MPTGNFRPNYRALDDDNKPLAYGRVYTYSPDSEELKLTYSNPGKTILNDNPVTLNHRGEASIYFNGLAKLYINDAHDTQVNTLEKTNQESIKKAAASQSGACETPENQAEVNVNELCSDTIEVGGVSYQDYATSLQDAIDNNSEAIFYFGAGDYYLSKTINPKKNQSFEIDGTGSARILTDVTQGVNYAFYSSGEADGVMFDGLDFEELSPTVEMSNESSWGSTSIRITDCDNVTIQNCSSKGYTQYGFIIDSTNENEIQSPNINNNVVTEFGLATRPEGFTDASTSVGLVIYARGNDVSSGAELNNNIVTIQEKDGAIPDASCCKVENMSSCTINGNTFSRLYNVTGTTDSAAFEAIGLTGSTIENNNIINHEPNRYASTIRSGKYVEGGSTIRYYKSAGSNFMNNNYMGEYGDVGIIGELSHTKIMGGSVEKSIEIQYTTVNFGETEEYERDSVIDNLKIDGVTVSGQIVSRAIKANKLVLTNNSVNSILISPLHKDTGSSDIESLYNNTEISGNDDVTYIIVKARTGGIVKIHDNGVQEQIGLLPTDTDATDSLTDVSIERNKTGTTIEVAVDSVDGLKISDNDVSSYLEIKPTGTIKSYKDITVTNNKIGSHIEVDTDTVEGFRLSDNQVATSITVSAPSNNQTHSDLDVNNNKIEGPLTISVDNTDALHINGNVIKGHFSVSPTGGTTQSHNDMAITNNQIWGSIQMDIDSVDGLNIKSNMIKNGIQITPTDPDTYQSGIISENTILLSNAILGESNEIVRINGKTIRFTRNTVVNKSSVNLDHLVEIGANYVIISDNTFHAGSNDSYRLVKVKGTASDARIINNHVRGVFEVPGLVSADGSGTFWDRDNTGEAMEAGGWFHPAGGGDILSGTGVTSNNIAVLPAQIGDIVEVSPGEDIQGCLVQGFVDSDGQVKINLFNQTGSTVTGFSSKLWYVRVKSFQNDTTA
ncbi:MAG: hypothetical protein HQL52_19670 [Magnetococcales bacterium]|nr:hypothetical protein [Magnetococcales bacterium]